MDSVDRPLRSGTWLRMVSLLATLVVAGCWGSSGIRVERSAALPNENGKFVVLPVKTQEGAKDYGKYADQITAKLSAKGLARVEVAAQARYALMFSYDGDGLASASEERRRNFPEKKSDDDKVVRTLSINLYDLTRPHQHDEVVFAAQAHLSLDRTADKNDVIAALIDAALQDFPGSSRENFNVSYK
jgi:hypothetical protein